MFKFIPNSTTLLPTGPNEFLEFLFLTMCEDRVGARSRIGVEEFQEPYVIATRSNGNDNLAGRKIVWGLIITFTLVQPLCSRNQASAKRLKWHAGKRCKRGNIPTCFSFNHVLGGETGLLHTVHPALLGSLPRRGRQKKHRTSPVVITTDPARAKKQPKLDNRVTSQEAYLAPVSMTIFFKKATMVRPRRIYQRSMFATWYKVNCDLQGLYPYSGN